MHANGRKFCLSVHLFPEEYVKCEDVDEETDGADTHDADAFDPELGPGHQWGPVHGVINLGK